jgi:hypothetical protein
VKFKIALLGRGRAESMTAATSGRTQVNRTSRKNLQWKKSRMLQGTW